MSHQSTIKASEKGDTRAPWNIQYILSSALSSPPYTLEDLGSIVGGNPKAIHWRFQFKEDGAGLQRTCCIYIPKLGAVMTLIDMANEFAYTVKHDGEKSILRHRSSRSQVVGTTWTSSQDLAPKTGYVKQEGGGWTRLSPKTSFTHFTFFSETGNAPRSQEYIRSVSWG